MRHGEISLFGVCVAISGAEMAIIQFVFGLSAATRVAAAPGEVAPKKMSL